MTECLLLGLSEEYFWESTPKKIIALIDQKKKIEEVSQKNLAIYIASYVWGKDPDELKNEDKRPIPGIDIPADESLVNRLI